MFNNNCICNLPTLVILILIILQFSKDKHDDFDKKDSDIGNGILFIIALFFLSCASCRSDFGCEKY